MEVIEMKKKIILGLMASVLLTGVVGCSNAQSTSKKMDDKKTHQKANNKMNMTDEQMKNMKKKK
jgi:protein involved in sex pheromone biosynthesis